MQLLLFYLRLGVNLDLYLKMSLLRLNRVDLSFGGPSILSSVNFQIEPTERIGILGRNGAGKSSLLKLLYGEISPDSGKIIRKNGIKISMLQQEISILRTDSVFHLVSQGFIKTPNSISSSKKKKILKIRITLSELKTSAIVKILVNSKRHGKSKIKLTGYFLNLNWTVKQNS